METNFEPAGPLRFLESECNWFISDMQCGRLGLNQPYRPRCVFRITIEASGIEPHHQFPGTAGVGFGFALPLRPLRAGVGVGGGIGPASSPGVTGATGVTGAATGSAAAGFAGSAGTGAGASVRRDFAARDLPAGVNEQTRVAPSTLVSVSRSRDFFARIETIVGTTLGCSFVPGVNSPNCMVTAV